MLSIWASGMFRRFCSTLEKSKADISESLSEEAGLCNQGQSFLYLPAALQNKVLVGTSWDQIIMLALMGRED